MEDILDLHPNDEDMCEFHEEEMGAEWPEGGMACPVVGCPSGTHLFKKLGSYWCHFHRFHRRHITLYHCPLCSLKDIKMSEVRRHMKKRHRTSSTLDIRKETVLNNKYVDPGTFRRPRPRVHREERERAREERQRTTAAPLFSLTEDHNPRDEKCPVGGFRK